jgi:hypothetical protein
MTDSEMAEMETEDARAESLEMGGDDWSIDPDWDDEEADRRDRLEMQEFEDRITGGGDSDQ